ncbi:DUF6191 domain-containing protein [Georgenia ruanii]|uniref:DUF6191 domain-containing protein n=1 Tax=Georgenia ruanii TaxID=348442 RepID=UPI00186B47C0|nr:DUF6191 domain-containing protein [Georgenia ruanii]
MSEFFAIFEPGLRHLIEERERRRLDIQRPGEGAPPFGPVDLDAGVAYIEEPRPGGGDGPAADGVAPPPSAGR